MPSHKYNSNMSHYNEQILKKIKSNRSRWQKRLRELSRIKHNPPKKYWATYRGPKDYESIFYPLIRKDIDKFVLDLSKKFKEPFRVFEDGMGKGIFLMWLKKLLNDKGISNITTGSTLEYPGYKDEILKSYFEVDNIFKKPTEFIKLDEKQHLIISNLSALNYTINPLRKLLLLKLAYSLEVGGVMLVSLGLPHGSKYSPEDYSKLGVDNVEDALFDSKKFQQTQIHALIKILEKRGFKAKYSYTTKKYSNPSVIFMIERFK